jgi:hypothetical protein
MSQRFRKGAALVGGVLLSLIGAVPDDGWTVIGRALRAVSDHPIRAGFVVIGLILVVYAFWNHLLDILGIQSRGRLESNVRTWLDAFQFSVKRLPNDKAYFEFRVTPDKGPSFIVGNYREPERYLFIIGSMRLADEQKAIYDQLSEYHQNVVGSKAIMELARTSVNYDVDLGANKIELFKRIPMTADLNEHALMTSIDELSNARSIFMRSLGLSMAELGKPLEPMQVDEIKKIESGNESKPESGDTSQTPPPS